jgi:hypothetical protein
MGTDVADQAQQALAKEAFEVERRIVANAQSISVATWELSKDLYELHERGLFRALGYDTLEEFLAMPELGMSRAQFFRLTRTWRDLVVVRQVPEERVRALEPSKVHEVLPKVMKGDAILNDALDDAEHLGFRDLRIKYGTASREDREKARGEKVIRASYEPLGDDTAEPVDDVEGTNGSSPDELTPASEVLDVVANSDDVTAVSEPHTHTLVDVSWQHLAEELAEALWEVALEVAPKEKKKVSGALRQRIYDVIERARGKGLVP